MFKVIVLKSGLNCSPGVAHLAEARKDAAYSQTAYPFHD